MNPSDDGDTLAYETLAWAYGQKRAMTKSQHQAVKATIREARAESHEAPYLRRLRLWNLGPSWARRST